jgi:hypothetical protein
MEAPRCCLPGAGARWPDVTPLRRCGAFARSEKVRSVLVSLLDGEAARLPIRKKVFSALVSTIYGDAVLVPVRIGYYLA